MSDDLAKQLATLFIVVDFWFTKNYCGPKMIGLRWFFKQDIGGKDRFHYEFRINEQYLSATNVRTFWSVLILYSLIPFLYYYIVGMDFDVEHVQLLDFILLGLMIASGLLNLFMFYKASTFASKKKLELRRRFGTEFINKFGHNSGLSFI